ncbi:hypothetical protein [Streptomyces sp. NBC_00091]|uniref:hypothetical protein n=1 Tax=Streptomyces sp. NBC_00091 TaxID=2975648 RepID=UPI00225A7292|nr:hypothetical protein [Streptomyces sp. NBC_00091]MCX5375472.1 hypothetical protein [Streptomyces sp. NBC_00091]
METAPTRVVVRPSYAKWAAWVCWSGLAAGGVLLGLYVDRRRTLPDEVPLQLAGGWERACRIVYGQSLWCPAPGGQREPFRRALWLDSFLFIPGYALALLAVFGLGSCFLYRKVTRRLMLRCLAATGVMAAADICENVFLYRALDGLGTGADGDWRKASWCALLKWALAGPLTMAAVWIALTLVARFLLLPRAVVKTTGATPPGTPPAAGPAARAPRVRKAHELANRGVPWDDPDIITPPAAPHAITAVAEWANPSVTAEPPDSVKERWRTRALELPGRKPAEVGICVSGGGIRSASVTLGALQALREGGVLTKARYLVSVSGGGYMSGAFQLALTGRRPAHLANAGLATVRDVFAPGSPEEDHIRRHAKYLADSPREKLLAAGIVLRGLFVSLGLLALAFIVVGVYLGAFYHLVPLTDLDRLRTYPTASFPGLSEQLHAEVRTPLIALLALAAVVSVAASLIRSHNGKSRPPWVRTTVKGILALAAAVAVFAVVLPAMVWCFAWLANRADLPQGPKGISVFGALTAAATGLGGLFTAARDRVTKVRPDGDKAGPFSGAASIVTRTGAGWVQTLVVWLVLTLVAFFGLALVSWSAVYAHGWSGWWQWGLPALLLFSALAVDQTTFSLHPFYRQRLAGAFAVRRAVLRDGSVGALPYDYNAESTSLSTYGKRVTGGEDREGGEGGEESFPQTIFVASAALSLRNRTAPGRPAVPFTFSHDYVGGPDTGWVRTTTMENTAHPLIGRDLTVQSAVAVSGAAFASAMGTQSMAAQRLLALSNLRLGTWVPNPLYLAEVAQRGPDWVMPRLPRVRRLRYQLQELVGRYSDSSPMLLCTDGGHFDNLGLVELLRLRCRTVYVIDSSGDSPPLATTLAQAVTLAYEDLGVQITFDQKEVLKLVPGSAEKVAPEAPMAALNTRFSASCLVKGAITYPEDVEFEEGKPRTRHGTIVFAKASLTPDMPYELLSYALREKAFPRRSTMDQWFDHSQFDAYRELGYHLGAAAVWPAPVKRHRLFDRAGRHPAGPPRSG